MARAWVQSYGAVSCFGLGKSALSEGVFQGKSGLRPLKRYPSCKIYQNTLGGEVAGWENLESERGDKSWAFLWGKFAIQECLQDRILRKPLPLVVSTTLGEMECFRPSDSDGRSYHQLASDLTRFFDLRGPFYTINTACSSSLNALIVALQLLKSSQFPEVLVLGVEALSPFVVAGFSSLQALAPERVQPFSLHRQGLQLSEGAGAILLSAEKKNAEIALVAYGNSGDAHHLTGPHPQAKGLIRAIQACLHQADRVPQSIDYLHAHGTGTLFNDQMETKAIHELFGDYAFKLPISSSKSMIGHALGAAGALESIICFKALQEQKVPPTLYCSGGDPACDLDYIPGSHPRPLRLRSCLKTASGFGGQNSALLWENS
jgi:3-oxoacyl-(acyl-carrier-protein) synthase